MYSNHCSADQNEKTLTSAASKGISGKWSRIICAVVAVSCVFGFLIAAFLRESDERKIVGQWCEVEENGNAGSRAFTIYDDGSCDLQGYYGLGKWSISNGKLIIQEFYGAKFVFEYSLRDDYLLLSSEGRQEMYVNTLAPLQDGIGWTIMMVVCGLGILIFGASALPWDNMRKTRKK